MKGPWPAGSLAAWSPLVASADHSFELSPLFPALDAQGPKPCPWNPMEIAGCWVVKTLWGEGAALFAYSPSPYTALPFAFNPTPPCPAHRIPASKPSRSPLATENCTIQILHGNNSIRAWMLNTLAFQKVPIRTKDVLTHCRYPPHHITVITMQLFSSSLSAVFSFSHAPATIAVSTTRQQEGRQ